MASTWIFTDSDSSAQAVGDSSTTANFPLGTTKRAYHATYGQGEFIYLEGNSSIIVNTLVYWDKNHQATILPAVSTTKKTGRSVAVALGTVANDSYGWFQIGGKVAILKTAVAVAADSPLYVSTTAGRFYGTASAGAQIVGARTINSSSVTTTTSTVLCLVNRPTVQGYS
jgi:hypothetical protein